MGSLRVHIIHVGNMVNKGTQALLKSDVFILREILGEDIILSVSTTDVSRVKRLNLSFNAVLPPLVDIPYEKADFYAKRLGFTRADLLYKVFAAGSLILMFFQVLLSAFSAFLEKLGLRGIYRARVLEYMKNADVVISYSDENFKESASLLPLNVYWILTWWSMLLSRTWDVLTSRFLGKRVVMFPNSVGPFRTWLGVLLAKIALNMCNFILVREPISFKVVNSLGITSPKLLTSDTALLFDKKRAVNFNPPLRPVIGVSPGIYAQSLSKEKVNRYINEHARALDKMIKECGFFVVFLPHYISGFQFDDLEISKLILTRMKNKRYAQIVESSSVEEFKSILDSMDIVVSSKMHPAVLAVSGHIPTLCIAYDQKQTGFFLRLGLKECVVSIREFSYELLLSKIKYVWEKKEEIRAVLRQRVPNLQQEIKETIKFALLSSINAKG